MRAALLGVTLAAPRSVRPLKLTLVSKSPPRKRHDKAHDMVLNGNTVEKKGGRGGQKVAHDHVLFWQSGHKWAMGVLIDTWILLIDLLFLCI